MKILVSGIRQKGVPGTMCGAYHQKTALTTQAPCQTLRRNDKEYRYGWNPGIYRKEYGSISTDKRTCEGSFKRAVQAVI